MKITRKTLLIIIAAMGAFLILYTVFRQLTGIGLSESAEKWMMDIIIFGALGLFVYNRKLAGEEKRAREAAERQAAEEAAAKAAPVEAASNEAAAPDDEDRPHWERRL